MTSTNDLITKRIKNQNKSAALMAAGGFKKNIQEKFIRYLDGSLSLPDTYGIGNDCRKKHGKDGKTVRRRLKTNKGKATGVCLLCERESWKKSDMKKPEAKIGKKKKIDILHKRAMDAHEEIMINREMELFI